MREYFIGYALYPEEEEAIGVKSQTDEIAIEVKLKTRRVIADP